MQQYRFVLRLAGRRGYWVRTPWWLKQLFPSFTWDIPTRNREIFLSFDDGPHPQATPFVLDCLKAAGAKASFFCVGKNAQLYPQLLERIVSEGHVLGNHSFSHPDGWKTETSQYIEDVRRGAAVVQSRLFRPPYGRITRGLARELRKQLDCRIVMWNVLSGDFDSRISGADCAENVTRYAKPGAIVVFHDSEKALPHLRQALPVVLDVLGKKGYAFSVIPGAG